MKEVHDIAGLWPEMAEDEWNEFRADIAENGLLVPIVTWRGSIVEGKHRELACREVGVKPRYDSLSSSWYEWRVVLHCMSLHRRRNLDPTQRACVGDLARARFEPAAKERQHKANPSGKRPLPPRGGKGAGRTAARDAAMAVGSSERSIERAGFVRKQAPEAFELARAGKLPLKVAERVAKAAPKDRSALLQQLTTKVRDEDSGDSWGTPKEWINLARLVMGGIDVDPASNDEAQKIVRAGEYFTRSKDGLAQNWIGRVWLNPPYSQPSISRFTEKLIAELKAKHTKQACVLVNNTTDTQVGQALLGACSAVLFPAGRISFVVPGTTTTLEGTRQGQMLLYYGSNVKRFVSACAKLGWVGVAS
jgi:ParB family chromosome partitioning protein